MSSSSTRTIDNLGIGASVRYAKDQADGSEQLFEDARIAQGHVQISVTSPATQSQVDLLFDIGTKNRSWSSFYPPENYNASHRSVFTNQIIPSLGSQEMMDVQMQKIEEEKLSLTDSKAGVSPENIVRGREECEKMLHFHQGLIDLDRDFIEIEGRRNQYSKG